jgi:hypothetical protein
MTSNFIVDLAKLKRRVIKSAIHSLKLNEYFDKQEHSGILKIFNDGYGHAKSKERKKSLNAEEQPIPWFTYPAIEYISQLNLTDKNVLEWGAGNSSLFFSKISKNVFSIEHNKNWHDEILALQIPNQKLLYREEKLYVEAIKDFNVKFDIIVIDGILREECSKIAMQYLKNDGLIILDNSDRDPEIANFLRNNNLIEVDMHGFGPINDYTWTTSLFFTRSFNFEPNRNQPEIPIGGGF